MWLAVLLAASVAATAVHLSRREDSKYLLLVLWGATVMVFVDWLWGYLEGGSFIPEEALEDPVGSSLLGLAMVLASVPVWAAAVLVKKFAGKPRWRLTDRSTVPNPHESSGSGRKVEGGLQKRFRRD